MEVGTKAPDFLGLDENGNEIHVSDFKGKKLVLYFYPKDSTPGCTQEACNLRDNYERFLAKGYAVVGVSVQDAKSHLKFKAKNNLPFPLIADTTLLQQLGAWGEKTMCGRKCMGTLRTTWLLNEQGEVEKIFTPKEIKTKIHAEQILEYINK